jgi:hypothetical protein
MLALATAVGTYAALFAVHPSRSRHHRARTLNGIVAALCAAYLVGTLS